MNENLQSRLEKSSWALHQVESMDLNLSLIKRARKVPLHQLQEVNMVVLAVKILLNLGITTMKNSEEQVPTIHIPRIKASIVPQLQPRKMIKNLKNMVMTKKKKRKRKKTYFFLNIQRNNWKMIQKVICLVSIQLILIIQRKRRRNNKKRKLKRQKKSYKRNQMQKLVLLFLLQLYNQKLVLEWFQKVIERFQVLLLLHLSKSHKRNKCSSNQQQLLLKFKVLV